MRRPQPGLIRLTHWLNGVFLTLMAGSGLQIFAAYPRVGPAGQPVHWYPLQGWIPPSALRIGNWLAGARHIHFAFAWFLLANAIAYSIYVAVSGEWRRRLFLPRRDALSALSTGRAYLHGRRAPSAGLYNGLQRLAYSAVLIVTALEILSGVVLYKPVQLEELGQLIGGYEAARSVHLLGLFALALFTVMHVTMVALHPRSLIEMVAGGDPHGPSNVDAP